MKSVLAINTDHCTKDYRRFYKLASERVVQSHLTSRNSNFPKVLGAQGFFSPLSPNHSATSARITSLFSHDFRVCPQSTGVGFRSFLSYNFSSATWVQSKIGEDLSAFSGVNWCARSFVIHPGYKFLSKSKSDGYFMTAAHLRHIFRCPKSQNPFTFSD